MVSRPCQSLRTAKGLSSHRHSRGVGCANQLLQRPFGERLTQLMFPADVLADRYRTATDLR
jgi:hypothetical protein